MRKSAPSTRRAGNRPEEDPNLRCLLEAHTPTVSIFGKSWTLHVEVALGVSLDENLAMIASSVAFLCAHGKRVIYDAEHFFDGYKADEAVGNKRRVLVSDLSGQSNVRYKAAEFGITLNEKDEARQAVQRIKELEHLGYEFQGAEASFELLLRAIQGEETNFFSLERLRVRSEHSDAGEDCSEATIVVRVQGDRELAVAEGIGPVDALSQALHEALCRSYPSLEAVRLADYKVRVLNPEDATAAVVRVLIEHHDGERSWHTVGVSANILEASWQALADGIRYHLFHNAGHPAAALALSVSASGA